MKSDFKQNAGYRERSKRDEIVQIATIWLNRVDGGEIDLLQHPAVPTLYLMPRRLQVRRYVPVRYRLSCFDQQAAVCIKDVVEIADRRSWRALRTGSHRRRLHEYTGFLAGVLVSAESGHRRSLNIQPVTTLISIVTHRYFTTCLVR